MVELILLGLLGLAMGSFIDALTWRLRTKRNFITGRSECEACHHVLGVADLIPVLSWVLLRGRCRYCRARLSPVASLTELTMAGAFVASYLWWPYGMTSWEGTTMLALWLICLVLLGALFIYDLRWMLLPDGLVFLIIILAFAFAVLRVGMGQSDPIDYAFIAFDALCLTFIYWVLHTASKGRWVGYGDVKLSIFIGLILGWQKALLAFGLANVIGLLVLVPGLLSRRLTRRSRIPFGPFLIVGCVVVFLWGSHLVEWYLGLLGV